MDYFFLSALACLSLTFLIIINSKKKYTSGTVMTTRSNKLIQGIDDRIQSIADKYRHILECLDTLASGTVDEDWRRWLLVLRPLLDSDIKGLTNDMEGGEGHKTLSWIWNVYGVGVDADEGTSIGKWWLTVPCIFKSTNCAVTALRIEWCKARARAHRWQEECILLAEEMRRVIEFFKWDSGVWEKRALKYTHLPAPLPSEGEHESITARNQREHKRLYAGKAAYARKQARIRSIMASQAVDLFQNLPITLSVMADGTPRDILVESANV